MAVTDANVDVGLTGAFSKGPVGATAPTNATTAIDAAYVDAGAISEDGISLTLPGAGDRTTIKIWQNGRQVRTLRSTSDDLASVTVTFLETNKTSVETYFNVTLTQTATDGSFEYAGDTTPDPAAYVADILDGAKSKRFHIPRGVRAEVGDLVFKNDEPIGYEVTIECENDPTAGYAFKYWDTGLKSA